MNADAFRHFYQYHFSENHIIWEHVSALSEAEFTRDPDYSRGSVKDQVLHLISADDSWFCELRGVPVPRDLKPADFPDRPAIRAHWDAVEASMQAYLAGLRDDMLFTRPLEGEDAVLYVWQVLLHVGNHGTDHRAQLLRQLHDLGVKTTSQDYIFYIYDHPVKESA
jgi:uncharacterized damage-inducible protein DinB